MSRIKKAAIGGVLAGVFGLVLIPFVWEMEEDIGLDLLFRLRGERAVPNNVVIVTLDKDSAIRLNLPPEPYKWPRSLHARLVDNLIRQGAALIAFDMIFKEPGPVAFDTQFAEAINRAGSVVLCKQLDKDSIPLANADGSDTLGLEIESIVPLVPAIAEAAIASAPFPLPKVPVKVSQCWVFKPGAGDIPTFPAVSLQVYALDVYDVFVQMLKQVDPVYAEKIPANRDEVVSAKGVEHVVLSIRDIFLENPNVFDMLWDEIQKGALSAMDAEKIRSLESLLMMYQGGNSRYLDFYGPPGTVHTIPYYQLTPLPEQPSFDLKGKAVFVGLSERLRPEEKDGFYTAYSQSSGVDISGVEIAATAFANLMENKHVRPFSLPTHIFVVFFCGLLLGVFCRLVPSVIAAAGVLGIAALYLAGAHYQFKASGIWFPIVLPVFFQVPVAFFGTVIWKFFETHRERQNVRTALGYYVPERVADQVTESGGDIRESKEIIHGTLLCTDAENYTTLSEALDPEALARIMNEYFEKVFAPVKQHGGIISEVVADSMIALWPAVGPATSHRAQACEAALEIVKAVSLFNISNPVTQLPTRIGLHTGRMMVGNIGAMDRYEYNPVGDIVNTASRIEGLNKHLGTRILASREVVSGLNDFLIRDLGEFVLAGKSEPIGVCELIGLKEAADEAQYRRCSLFQEALDVCRNQEWEKGIRIFSDIRKMNGGDGPSVFYLELCKRYREHPGLDPWDGVVCLREK